MPITVPHTASGKRTTAGTTTTVTITAPSAGNLLVCTGGGFANVTSVTGGGVTTWTSITTFTGDANHNDADTLYGVVDTTPSTTVTVNHASTAWMGFFVLEIAGGQKANENLVVFANDAQLATDSKTCTTTTDGDVIVSTMSYFGSSALTATLPTGYTTAGVNLNNATSSLVGVAYLIQTTHGASSMNWTGMGANAFPALGGVAVKAAAAAASGRPVQPVVGQEARRRSSRW